MEYFLNKVSQQAVSFAIRTGIVVTSQFALRQCGRYISSIKGSDRRQLQQLQERLETTIRIISPAIDLVEIISARGNTSLESALTMTKDLRHEIQELGVRLSNLTAPIPGQKRRQRSQEEINAVMADIRKVLQKIEDAVPLISLAVTTSGVRISASIPQSVSPSRLLQASTLLTAGDTAYTLDPFKPAQIGTTFTLSLYMLFSSHAHRQEHVSATDLTWQEVISKCRVKLQRVPLFYEDNDNQDRAIRAQHKIDEFCYELCLIEDLDDGRVHDTAPVPYEDVAHAGLCTRIPVHQISKMFYTTSGKLLGIEESSSPILLIKRNKNAVPPRRLVERAQGYEYDAYSDDEDDSEPGYQLDLHEGESTALDFAPQEEPGISDLPAHLDPEWLAFEVFQEQAPDDSDDDDDDDDEVGSSANYAASTASTATLPSSPPTAVTTALQNLALTNSSSATLPLTRNAQPALPLSTPTAQTQSTLSILECLLRLTILQNYQQANHLSVHDELLNLFLSDAAWDGNPEHRAVEREKAKMKLGFDPFGSSPAPARKENPRTPRGSLPRMQTAPPASVDRKKEIESSVDRGGRLEHDISRKRPDPTRPVTPGRATLERERDRSGMRERRYREVEEVPWTPDRQLSEEWGSSPLPRR